jgi:hypothetical protein
MLSEGNDWRLEFIEMSYPYKAAAVLDIENALNWNKLSLDWRYVVEPADIEMAEACNNRALCIYAEVLRRET